MINSSLLKLGCGLFQGGNLLKTLEINIARFRVLKYVAKTKSSILQR